MPTRMAQLIAALTARERAQRTNAAEHLSRLGFDARAADAPPVRFGRLSPHFAGQRERGRWLLFRHVTRPAGSGGSVGSAPWYLPYLMR